jgi:hypothetical protein
MPSYSSRCLNRSLAESVSVSSNGLFLRASICAGVGVVRVPEKIVPEEISMKGS